MAHLTITMFSTSLNRPTTFQMMIPNDGETAQPTKALFLLHGYTSGAWNWIPEVLSQKYNFAVVTPNGENSFWLDGISSGHKFCTLIGEEIPRYLHKTFGLANSADDTYIMGLSMGGFGALHTALRYPGQFGKAGAMSSALIVHEVAEMRPGSHNGRANYEYYRECFGEPEKVIGSENDPEFLALQLKERGGKLPEIYMCCGTEDFLLENNRQMHAFLTEHDIPHEYHESAGGHDMTFWNEYTAKIIKWMFEEK